MTSEQRVRVDFPLSAPSKGNVPFNSDEAQRNSGRVQRFVRFCYYVPKLLLLFLGRVLLQDTGELQEPHLTYNVYR